MEVDTYYDMDFVIEYTSYNRTYSPYGVRRTYKKSLSLSFGMIESRTYSYIPKYETCIRTMNCIVCIFHNNDFLFNYSIRLQSTLQSTVYSALTTHYELAFDTTDIQFFIFLFHFILFMLLFYYFYFFMYLFHTII